MAFTGEIIKPPLGVRPKSIWLQERADELAGAIAAHVKHDMVWHPEIVCRWIDELREIITSQKL